MWSKYEQNPVQITMLLFRLFVGAFIKNMNFRAPHGVLAKFSVSSKVKSWPHSRFQSAFK
jgi:hypothetical protein